LTPPSWGHFLISPPGAKFYPQGEVGPSPRGELYPQGPRRLAWSLSIKGKRPSVCPFVLLNMWTKGWTTPLGNKVHPWGPSSVVKSRSS
jgi:hypothetical protein